MPNQIESRFVSLKLIDSWVFFCHAGWVGFDGIGHHKYWTYLLHSFFACCLFYTFNYEHCEPVHMHAQASGKSENDAPGQDNFYSCSTKTTNLFIEHHRAQVCIFKSVAFLLFTTTFMSSSFLRSFVHHSRLFDATITAAPSSSSSCTMSKFTDSQREMVENGKLGE